MSVMILCDLVFFFFKQKTAYELRISDWSSDVCSSDLVELSPPAEEMGVAEGIETALAVTRDFGIPCWSTISADGLKAFTPPAIVKRLRIFGDNDPKYGGQAAAYALAHRMSVRLDCVECSVEIPNQTGTDWADRRDA